MDVTIRLTKALSRFSNGKKQAVYPIESACNISAFIGILEKDMSGLTNEVLTGNGEISDSINIYVNGENIRYLDGLKTRLSDQDQISIIPAAAAG